MLAIDYYHKLKKLYRKETAKASYIYIYCNERIPEKIMFKFDKNKYKEITDFPKDELLLSRDKVLPQHVLVQIQKPSLKIMLYEY